MNVLSISEWSRLVPEITASCPRLTADDLAECQCRLDLLAAKIQSRQWISRAEAQRLIFAQVHRLGILHVSA